MFDYQPVIVKEWTDEDKLVKHVVDTVPIGAKLQDLELKLWGEECLSKICKKIGKYIKSDHITQQRTFLSYVRVMLEVKVGREFPKTLEFTDEKGYNHKVLVTYDWIPSRCAGCKGLGHVNEECRANEIAKKGNNRTRKPAVKYNGMLKPSPLRPVKPIQGYVQQIPPPKD